MSGGSFAVPPLSRRKIRAIARNVRTISARFGGSDGAYFDIVRFLDVILPKLDSDFVLEILPKEEMGTAHGMTFPEEHLIQIREDVYQGAVRGEGRDRLTLSHELGHYVLHSGIGMARAVADESVPVYRQSEWQANAFGGELLVFADYIPECDDVAEAMTKFGVSSEAAEYQWSKCEEDGLTKEKAVLSCNSKPLR